MMDFHAGRYPTEARADEYAEHLRTHGYEASKGFTVEVRPATVYDVIVKVKAEGEE